MFSIQVKNLHWIDTTADDPKDKCLHGDVSVQIGDECFGMEDATVSATAFYLLRSLTRDHIMYSMGIQLLPCCGFDMYFWQGELVIIGCPNGIDWSVIHENGQIKLITDSEQETVVPLETYKQAVFAFADEIEAFYQNSQTKVFNDEEDRCVYHAFWDEWHQ